MKLIITGNNTEIVVTVDGQRLTPQIAKHAAAKSKIKGYVTVTHEKTRDSVQLRV